MKSKNASFTASFHGIEGRKSVCASFSDGMAESMRNFRIDANGNLRRREGFVKFCTLRGTLRGYCFGKISNSRGDTFYYCTDDGIYSVISINGAPEHVHTLVRANPEAPVEMFIHGKKIYLLSDGEYYVFDHSTIERVEGYVPLRYDDLIPYNGVGSEVEAPNALTRLCRARYSPQEVSTVFLLPELAKEILSVTVNGQTVAYRVEAGLYDPLRLQVVLQEAVPSGTKTVEIVYKDTRLEQRQRILECTHCYRYGGSDDLRLFFYGNDRAEIFYSVSVASHPEAATYFPYDGVLRISTDAPVTGIMRRYNHLLIHTTHETFAAERDANGYRLYLVNDRIGNLTHGNMHYMGQDTCTLSQDGIYRLHMTSLQGDRVASRISDRIARLAVMGLLQSAKTIQNKSECEIWFATNTDIWVYRYDLDVWYAFDLPQMDEFLSLGSVAFRNGNVIYRYESGQNTDNGKSFTSYWEGVRFCPATQRRPAKAAAIRLLGTKKQQVSLTLSAHQNGEVIAQKQTTVSASPLYSDEPYTIVSLPLPCADLYRLRVETTDGATVCALGLGCGEEVFT